MKIVNYYDIPDSTKARDLYEFVKKYYSYIDVLEISTFTLLNDLRTRTFYNQKIEKTPIKIFNKVFSNDYWRQNREICTPEIVTELYLYVSSLLEDGEEINESFLDICYHYGIVIFIKDLDWNDDITGLGWNNWTNIDKDIKSYLFKMYYVITNKYIPNKDHHNHIKNLEKRRIIYYKDAVKRFPEIQAYSINSLNYLYDELIN